MIPLRSRVPVLVSAVLAALLAAVPARAELDINNNGPQLDVGRFAMRVTNIGVVGNAFFNKGLSFDPSFEFPRGSGHECLEHAELWVSATREDGSERVSGGPMFEWRPTRDTTDRVLRRDIGDRGTRSAFDDDGDGRIDEEFLDGADDDGDGEVDEDLRFPAQQTLSATFSDDTRESVEFGYPSGEQHVPLGLVVKQEAHAWTMPGYDKVAALHWTITNRGSQRLRDVRLGVYADLDARDRSGGSGHLDDVVTWLRDSTAVFEGTSVIASLWRKTCVTTLKGEFPAVHDAEEGVGRSWSAVVGLSHTTDPLGYITNFAFDGARQALAAARAPRRDTAFTYTLFSPSLPPRQGGPPSVDADRAAALRGEFTTAPASGVRDYAVLLSSGPFRVLEPGQSVELMVAFLAAESADSLIAAAQSARLAWKGTAFNLLPDKAGTPSYSDGNTGIQGHELCYTPPAGVSFNYDPHCPEKLIFDPAYFPLPGNPPGASSEASYRPGQPCIWSDFDCDACTGLDGRETTYHWFVAAPAPPQPRFRSVPGDRQVTVEWDNLPELLADAGVVPGAPWTFWGYRVYRLDDWTRTSLLPAVSRWQQVASFGVDTTLGARPLRSVLDTTVAYDSVAYERRHYPVGRYRFVDTRVFDGFDYHYVVTAVAQRTNTQGGTTRADLLESPFRASFANLVRPRMASGLGENGGRVWVVPNPFRGSAPWERQQVPGDTFTRHLDFFGLPAARCTIRIYTLAGDLVRTLEHDGTGGVGQVAWDLISRNGQDVESGIYLFTVDWSGGHQTGRFVVIR